MCIDEHYLVEKPYVATNGINLHAFLDANAVISSIWWTGRQFKRSGGEAFTENLMVEEKISTFAVSDFGGQTKKSAP